MRPTVSHLLLLSPGVLEAQGFDLLDELALTAYRNPRPTADRETTELLRNSEGYVEAYDRYLTYQAFDILLDDGSIFFFRRDLQNQTSFDFHA